MPNINLKWFQLSFDVYIVHIGQKLYIFKNFRPGSWKFCFVRWGYFGTLFWKKFESQYGFWSFHRRIIMPKVLWVHFLVNLDENCGHRTLINLRGESPPPRSLDCAKSPVWLGLIPYIELEYFSEPIVLKYIPRKKILTPIYLIIKHSNLSGSKCFSRCLNMRFVLV